MIEHFRTVLCVAGFGLACATGAHAAAAAKTLSYVWPDFSSSAAYVVDWKARSKAHIGSNQGAGDGTFTDDGTQRVITLGAPISVTVEAPDCNGLPFTQRTDYTQFVFRPTGGTARKGTTHVVEIGTVTDLGGCTPGQVVPFGSLADPGFATNHLDMTARAPTTDLVPGVQIAGMSEDPYSTTVGSLVMAQQVATLGSGSITFEASQATRPLSVIDQWWAIALASGVDRRYTRLSQDARTGVERWLGADWVGGQIGPVWQVLMTKPRAGATFGTVKQAAHVWTSGLFIGSSTGLEYDLYKNFTGQRVLSNPDGSTSVQPLTWGFSGNDLFTTRTTGSTQRVRTWVPIATYGANHFVLEEEAVLFSDGSLAPAILPRVNFYVDGGAAVPPPGAR